MPPSADAIAEFGSRPGPVRDAILADHREWLALLEHESALALTDDSRADLVAFQIDAVLAAANTAMRLGDGAAATKVRRILDTILG